MSERIKLANVIVWAEGGDIPARAAEEVLALVEAVEAARPVVQNGLKGMLVTVGEWEAASAALARFEWERP